MSQFPRIELPSRTYITVLFSIMPSDQSVSIWYLIDLVLNWQLSRLICRSRCLVVGSKIFNIFTFSISYSYVLIVVLSSSFYWRVVRIRILNCSNCWSSAVILNIKLSTFSDIPGFYFLKPPIQFCMHYREGCIFVTIPLLPPCYSSILITVLKFSNVAH